ncbi:MAG TPA: glycosyltransferase family 4 protein [Bacteroidia bacterium]|nr:glycosyltransferase family 4 protein [Bacteroidia bacterium]
MKVIHFIWSASFGGIEKVVIDLCKAQKASGNCDPTLLIGAKKGSFIEKIEKSGISYLFGGFKSGSALSPRLYKNLKSVMQQYDLIHLHTFNPLVCFAAVKSGKPILYTIHGNFNFGRKMRLNDHINQYLRKLFFNHFINHITFNSEFTKSTAIKRYGLDNVPSTIVYNGIPLPPADFTSQITGSPNLFVVGTSSRFAGFKRIDRLISAFGLFAQDKSDVKLMLVGDGVLRAALEQQVKDLNLSDKTEFTGYRPDVSNCQSAMNVCVFPSNNEPFGLVAIETLSLGKPTIIFNDGGGMKEILSKELPDDIVKDVKDLALRLEYYYQHRYTEDTSQTALRKEIASRYSVEKMEQQMNAVYSILLAS